MAAKKSKANKPSGHKVRSLRHWRQQYDEDAAFIWRKACHWNGVSYAPGEAVPDSVVKEMGRNKLRRFWEAQRIELARFSVKQSRGLGTPVFDEAFLRGESNVGNQALVDEAEAKEAKKAQLAAARKASAEQKAADKAAAEAISSVEFTEDGKGAE